jgi:hypothetical protein
VSGTYTIIDDVVVIGMTLDIGFAVGENLEIEVLI